jgi:UDPglucose 6-dehydrogenase
MLSAVLEINTEQVRRTVSRLCDTLGGLHDAHIAVLGLAFKPGTDDIRESPAVELARLLQHEGAIVTGSDPVAIENTRRVLPNIAFAQDPYEAASDVDAIVIATDWPKYGDLDLGRLKSVMRTPVIADGRNMVSADAARSHGFIYLGIGMPVQDAKLQRGVLV